MLTSQIKRNIYGIGVGVTCVSLKSLTPTQYTIAPRDLALSACWKKEGINILLPENWRSSNERAKTAAVWEIGLSVKLLLYLLLCGDELMLLQLSVCQCNNHAGRAWRKHTDTL